MVCLQGLAALTLDDEYQRKRQEALNRRPASASEGLAQGTKGLVMGFYDGVTGVIRQPIKVPCPPCLPSRCFSQAA